MNDKNKLKRKKSMVIIAAVIVCTSIFLSGCGKRKTTGKDEISYQQITQDEAKERMDSKDPIVILDVRTKEEFDEGHIPDAILIPNETIGSQVLDELPDLDTEILIYCRSGNRSKQAAEKMAETGYTQIFEFGGINEWKYEIVK